MVKMSNYFQTVFFIIKGQKHPPVMSKKTSVIDFGEDRIPPRILSLNKGRRREKNEEEGFQLYFI